MNGFICVDEEQFINKLNKILNMESSELEKIKQVMKKKVITNYNVDSYTEKVLEVYNRAQRKHW